MEKISVYKAEPELLEKALCLIAEKCYHNKLGTVILTEDTDAQENLNKKLWTYSQKQFIPHGSRLDPHPEKQPIYITDTLQNPNKAEVIIVYNRHFNLKECQGFKRVVFLYENTSSLLKEQIGKIKDEIEPHHTFEQYVQNPRGQWVPV